VYLQRFSRKISPRSFLLPPSSRHLGIFPGYIISMLDNRQIFPLTRIFVCGLCYSNEELDWFEVDYCYGGRAPQASNSSKHNFPSGRPHVFSLQDGEQLNLQLPVFLPIEFV
jgi:hypothetical protein